MSRAFASPSRLRSLVHARFRGPLGGSPEPLLGTFATDILSFALFVSAALSPSGLRLLPQPRSVAPGSPLAKEGRTGWCPRGSRPVRSNSLSLRTRQAEARGSVSAQGAFEGFRLHKQSRYRRTGWRKRSATRRLPSPGRSDPCRSRKNQGPGCPEPWCGCQWEVVSIRLTGPARRGVCPLPLPG